MYLHRQMVVTFKSCLSEVAPNILNADVGKLSLKALVDGFSPVNLYMRGVKGLHQPHSSDLSQLQEIVLLSMRHSCFIRNSGSSATIFLLYFWNNESWCCKRGTKINHQRNALEVLKETCAGCEGCDVECCTEFLSLSHWMYVSNAVRTVGAS